MSCDAKDRNTEMNHIGTEEEEELGIYSDDDEGAGDLSDDEPPITEQDTSGRPQSQFKLRVTSAISSHNHRIDSQRYSATGTEAIANHLDFNPDSITEDLVQEPFDQLDELAINNENSSTRQRRDQERAEQQSNICHETKTK